MINKKFLTENARITSAYLGICKKSRMEESSNGSFLNSLRGELPIDGLGSPKTGSKLGMRKMLPFEKRDEKNCCGHAVPLKKNRQFEKITNDWRSKGGAEFSAGLTDKLNPRKLLPFEKRDEQPTNIGKISKVRDVGCVSRVRESVDDEDEFVDVDAEDFDVESSDENKDILELVLSTFEQIYDNLSDEDKDTVDEVKSKIESIVGSEDEDDENDEIEDVDDDGGEIGESYITEAGVGGQAGPIKVSRRVNKNGELLSKKGNQIIGKNGEPIRAEHVDIKEGKMYDKRTGELVRDRYGRPLHADIAEGGFLSKNKAQAAAEAYYDSLHGDKGGKVSKAAPETVVTREGAPEKGTAETAAPKDAAPEKGTPETAAPKDAAPETAAPKDAAPEKGAPETAAAEKGAPETAAAETAASREGAPKEGAAETAAAEKAAREQSKRDEEARIQDEWKKQAELDQALREKEAQRRIAEEVRLAEERAREKGREGAENSGETSDKRDTKSAESSKPTEAPKTETPQERKKREKAEEKAKEAEERAKTEAEIKQKLKEMEKEWRLEHTGASHAEWVRHLNWLRLKNNPTVVAAATLGLIGGGYGGYKIYDALTGTDEQKPKEGKGDGTTLQKTEVNTAPEGAPGTPTTAITGDENKGRPANANSPGGPNGPGPGGANGTDGGPGKYTDEYEDDLIDKLQGSMSYHERRAARAKDVLDGMRWKRAPEQHGSSSGGGFGNAIGDVIGGIGRGVGNFFAGATDGLNRAVRNIAGVPVDIAYDTVGRARQMKHVGNEDMPRGEGFAEYYNNRQNEQAAKAQQQNSQSPQNSTAAASTENTPPKSPEAAAAATVKPPPPSSEAQSAEPPKTGNLIVPPVDKKQEDDEEKKKTAPSETTATTTPTNNEDDGEEEQHG